MYAQESILDILFLMFYGAAAMLTLAAALYLWLRRTNAFALEMESPKEVRRWAAAFLLAATASHVWWMVFGTYWLTDDRLVRNTVLIALDHLTLVPLAVAVLLRMLQDRRRRLWPWLLAEMPVVVVAVAGIATHDERAIYWMDGWQTVVIVAFIVRYFLALREYHRWLEQNFANLEHKDIWRSLLVALGLCVVYEVYCTNPGLMPVEYLAQGVTIAVTCFLVWRVETLQTLTAKTRSESEAEGEASMPATSVETAGTVPIDFGTQLRERCEATGLYLQHDLTLAQLAYALHTNRTYLSAYFARQGTTYNAYVNELRISRFEQRYAETMSAPHAVVTAKDLATECGFSSYSTFGAAFKKHRGVTASEWMRQQSGKGTTPAPERSGANRQEHKQ